MLPNACQDLHSWNVNDAEQKSSRLLSVLPFMAAARATHSLRRNHIIGVCVCLHWQIYSSSHLGIYVHVYHSHALSLMCSLPKSRLHQNKTNMYEHTHSTSTAPVISLNQYGPSALIHLILPQVEVMTAAKLTGSAGLSLQ